MQSFAARRLDELLHQVPPARLFRRAVVGVLGVEQAEAFVMLGGHHHVLHSGGLGELRPLSSRVRSRSELFRELLVFSDGNALVLHHPLVPPQHAVQPPVDEHAEFRFVPPFHTAFAVGFGGGLGGGRLCRGESGCGHQGQVVSAGECSHGKTSRKSAFYHGGVPASLKRRVIEPEILDTLPAHEARRSLHDLTRLNRFFGGHTALRSLLRRLDLRRDQHFSVLDVGSASGDMGRELRRVCPNAKVVCLDYDAAHLRSAEQPKVAADAFRLPFSADTFDFVLNSLFLHHFDNDQVVDLLRGFGRVASRGVLTVDLDRRWIPYWFVPATRPLLGWDPVTSHDARASVAAAFRPQELAALAERAGFTNVNVRTHGLAYRITMLASRLR